MREPAKRTAKSMGASVRARLLNIARERGQTFDLLLVRYTLERFLYRLSLSAHQDKFVLKGAMLIATWLDNAHRPTRDVDLLGFGASQPEAILAVFRDICAIEADDGVAFDAGALRIDRNREDLEYGGLRVATDARVGGARVRVVVDIGFGDAVEPGLNEIELPVLLDLPAPPACLSERGGHRREVPGDGRSGPRQQPDEGFLRHLVAGQDVHLRG